MAFIIADRVKETSTTTGTGALALAGAMTGFQSFSAKCVVDDTLYYALQAVDVDGAPSGDWECGLGTYSAANTLTRTTVTSSSNAGAAVVLTAGTKQVFISMPAVQVAWARERLTTGRTYYVATTGNDANDGLTVGSPFLTIQKAVDITCSIDMSIYQVTIKLADGTYSAGALFGKYVGSMPPLVLGNATTPANVIVSATSLCFSNMSGFTWRVESLTAYATTSHAFLARNPGSSLVLVSTNCGAMGGGLAHIVAEFGAFVDIEGKYTISGGAAYHLLAQHGGCIKSWGAATVTLTGTPAFSSYFAEAKICGTIRLSAKTFSGSATGIRYSILTNGVINTSGNATTYFPGNVAGTTATGGQYI